jgi:hypothetical protein
MHTVKTRSLSLTYAVKEAVKNDVFIQDAIMRGYANISAVARVLKPEVEKLVGGGVNEESLITTLKRTRFEGSIGQPVLHVLADSTLSVKTGIARIVLIKSQENIPRLQALFKEHQDGFLEQVTGSSFITLVYEEHLRNELVRLFPKQVIISHTGELAAILVNSPQAIENTPGVVTTLYAQVYRRGINIEDTISCHTETMIVVKEKDVGKTLDALTELISTAKAAFRT